MVVYDMEGKEVEFGRREEGRRWRSCNMVNKIESFCGFSEVSKRVEN